MKALVTGAAGFIGSHLSEKLVDRGHSVIGVDNFDDFYARRIKEDNLKYLTTMKENFSFFEGDIRNKETLDEIMGGVDVVFHEAARPGVFPSYNLPEDYHRLNVDATFDLLRASSLSGVGRVVFASSSTVYGQAKEYPVKEDFMLNPTNPYGITKVLGEDYLKFFGRVYGLQYNILRYFSVYGPRQRPDLSIAEWTKQIFEENKIRMKGKVQFRDYTYIDDVVNAIVLAGESDVKNEICNVCYGMPIGLSEVIDNLILLSGKKVQVIDDGVREGDVLKTFGSNEKAKRLFGWEPKIGIKEGIERYIEWYRDYNL